MVRTHEGEFAAALAEDDQHTVDSTSRLRHAFRVLADRYEADPATGRAMVRAWQRAGGPLVADESDAPQLVANTVRAGQRAGDIPRDVDPDRVALILFDVYLGVLYRWVLDETDQLALGEQLTATLDLLLPAITRASSGSANGPNRRRTGSEPSHVVARSAHGAQPAGDRGPGPTQRLEVAGEALDVGAPRPEHRHPVFGAPGDVLA